MAVIAAFQNNPPYPIYAVPYTVIFPLLDADGDPVTGETCDSERSLDGDTGADCTNEGTEITFTTATNKGMYYLTLTAAELTSVVTIITVYASNSKATPIVLYPKALPPLADSTSTAGAAGTITLAVGSSAVDDYYAGCYIYLNGGTGSGQGRMITSYVGSTRIASIAPNWGTNPDDTSEYIIYQTQYALLNDGNLDAPVSVVDTVVDGIKTKTDGLNFEGNYVEAHIESIVSAERGNIATSVWAKAIGTPAAGTYGEALDDAALEATLTAMKGSGWSDETLKAIMEAVEAISAAAIADAVWDEDVTGHETDDTVGRALSGLFGKMEVVDNQFKIWGLSGTLLFTFDLTQDGTATEYNPDKREPV